jgi:hypothetical protein
MRDLIDRRPVLDAFKKRTALRRKPSERTLFERWWNDAMGTPRDELRALRSENGYETASLDWAWMAWQARAEVKR